MKFAVVEYNSKSGQVWHHTDDKPNYLADPKREIDPTSFGCYVSALKGEHIPLKGLIVGPVNSVSPPLRFFRKAIKRLTGSWPAYNIDYLLQFDALLVVHQLSDAHEMVSLLKKIRAQRGSSGPKLIGVPTQPYGQLRPAVDSDPKTKKNLVEFINNCDVFVSVVLSTVGWYESLAQSPIKYLPQPYPVDFAANYQQPRSQKDKTILVAGVTQRDNVKQGQIIARKLQKKFPEYLIIIPKVEEYEYDFSELADARYQVLPFEAWQQHLQTLAKTTLVINTDYTETRGRVQTDCAAVGTPSLGGNSDGTVDLFPELTSQPSTSTEDLIKRGEKLLNDTVYYDKIIADARGALQKYDYEQSAARLRSLIVKIDV